jgi:peptidyl-prolyl cis-trans isomerase A (cyclophilin A)
MSHHRWLIAISLIVVPAGLALAAPEPPPPPPALPKIEITRQVELDGATALSTDLVFDVGEATIRKPVEALLDAIAKAVAKDQGPKIVVHVYTDDTAPDNDHTGVWLQKLSQRRADTLKALLIRRGVAARRVSSVGHGSEGPIGDNTTEVGKRSNRRIEFVLEQEVRPPVAGDLAAYLKGVRGAGTLIATLATSKGTLHCELYEQQAPMTVANFVGLATGQKAWTDSKTGKTVKGKPFYDGLVFHRVIPQFMIQGGDPLGTGMGGPGYAFADETSASTLVHRPGTLAMANAGPGTNGSQFFIDEIEAPWLNGKHTVFGQCKETDVISAITRVPRDRGDVPTDPVTITRVTIARGSL